MKVRVSESTAIQRVSDPKRRVALKGLAAATAGTILPSLYSCASTSASPSVGANPIVETHAGTLRGINVAGVDVFKGSALCRYHRGARTVSCRHSRCRLGPA